MPVYRRMREEDIPVIGNLWLEMMREHHLRDSRFGLRKEAHKEYGNYLRELMNSPENAVFVADDAGRVVGYILALILDNPQAFEIQRYGFVGEMVVAKNLRRKGTGKGLWERAKGWFRRKGVSVVQLNVSPRNEEGKVFWSSVGFRDFLEIKWCDLEESMKE